MCVQTSLEIPVKVDTSVAVFVYLVPLCYTAAGTLNFVQLIIDNQMGWLLWSPNVQGPCTLVVKEV